MKPDYAREVPRPLAILIGAVIGCIVAACAVPVLREQTDTAVIKGQVSTYKPEVPATAPPAPVTPSVPSFEGDGVYIVGQHVEPGTYQSSGNVKDYMACWVDRFSDLEQTKKLDTVQSWGQVIVTIKPTDKVVQAHNCAVFTKL